MLVNSILAKIQTKSEARLSELGENKSNIKDVSAAVAKKVFSGRLTSAEADVINNSEYGNQVVEELSADSANTIWKDTIKSTNGNNLNLTTKNNAAQGVGVNADGGVANQVSDGVDNQITGGEQVKAVPVLQNGEDEVPVQDGLTNSENSSKTISKGNKPIDNGYRLPNSINASTIQEKIQGYFLNSNHPVGKHKARVLNSVLGYHYENWQELSDKLFDLAQTSTVTKESITEYGIKYKVPIEIIGKKGKSMVLDTVWQVDKGSNVPRFITATFDKRTIKEVK